MYSVIKRCSSAYFIGSLVSLLEKSTDPFHKELERDLAHQETSFSFEGLYISKSLRGEASVVIDFR